MFLLYWTPSRYQSLTYYNHDKFFNCFKHLEKNHNLSKLWKWMMKPLKFLKPIKIIIVPFSNRNKRSFLLPKESTTKKMGLSQRLQNCWDSLKKRRNRVKMLIPAFFFLVLIYFKIILVKLKMMLLLIYIY